MRGAVFKVPRARVVARPRDASPHEQEHVSP